MRLKTVQTVHSTLTPGSYDDHATVFVDGESERNEKRKFYLELNEELGMVTIRHTQSNATRLIPLSNIASIEPLADASKKGRAA